MAKKYSPAATNAFMKACEERDINGILKGLNDENTNVATIDSAGRSALFLIATSQAKGNASLVEIMRVVLAHDRIKNDKNILAPISSFKNFNIVDLYEGKYAGKSFNVIKNGGLAAVDVKIPIDDKEEIKNMIKAAQIGKFSKLIEKTNTLTGGASGAIAKNAFWHHNKKKFMLFMGAAVLSACAAYGFYVSEKNKPVHIPSGFVIATEVDAKNLKGYKITELEDRLAVRPQINNPRNLFVESGSLQPLESGSVIKDYRDAFAQGRVADVIDNLRLPENKGFWKILDTLDKLSEKSLPRVEPVKERTEEGMRKILLPSNDAIIYFDDTPGISEDLFNDIENQEMIDFTVVSQLAMKHAMYGSDELTQAIGTNTADKANAELLSFAYGNAMGLVYLAETNQLNNAYRNDRFDNLRLAIKMLQNDIEKNKNITQTEMLNMALGYVLLSGDEQTNPHESGKAIVNRGAKSKGDAAKEAVFKESRHINTMTSYDLMKKMPSDVKGNLFNYTKETLTSVMIPVQNYWDSVKYKTKYAQDGRSEWLTIITSAAYNNKNIYSTSVKDGNDLIMKGLKEVRGFVKSTINKAADMYPHAVARDGY